jgi:glycosyltransferase involved in cell wall biosynthesis
MPSKLKIFMIAPTPYFSDRGCHVRIYEEARALTDRGHEVVIVTYHLGRDLGDIPTVRIAKIPWYSKLAAGPSWHKLYLDVLLLYKAIVVSKQFKPDIVHAHLHEGAFLAAIAKRSLGAPLLFDCQGSLCGELLDHGFMRQNGLQHRFFAKIESWINRQADFIVTSSTPTAETLRAEFPEMSTRLKALLDAVDMDLFAPSPKDQKLFDELSLPKDKKIIVYLGAMTQYQGVDMLLNALQQLSLKRNDFHALLMGYPESDYIERARVLGLDDRITFAGKLDYAEAPRYLCLGDIAVSPKLSTSEANGKLLNYMACGLPCVVFDNPVNRELLGETGVYVENKNAAGFVDHLADLLDHPESLAALAEQSRAHAVACHSWRARIKILEQIYAGMMLA